MNQKDPIKGMLNAEWLLAHDPMNVGYLEGLFKNADKARCDDTVMWSGHALSNAAENEKKPSTKRFALLKEVYERLGDRAHARGELDLAAEAYERAVAALNMQARIDPKDTSIPNIRRDLSTKLTILKGKYQTAESFTDSMQDREDQADIHDQERMVQTSDRLAELIAKAERDMAENPGVAGKVMTLVDLLCREDNKEWEAKAIGVLVEEFKRTGEYRYKSRADDVRMRQLQRKVRRLKAAGDEESAREARIRQLRFELTAFKERTAKYPTDQRVRYEYASRLFQARKFDDAIPLFQTARADAKNRTRCDVYLGRCFFEKGYYDQAVPTLTKAIAAHEIPDSEDGKAMMYWLGRCQEAKGAVDEALGSYGQLLELDYNYRDVRDRMDGLRAQKGSEE
jgi:tetratricopeptide (TPR) repeat protein